jgi:hypothetical protein
LLWGILLLPVGFGIQAIALLKSKALARGRALFFLIGILLIGMPDGVEVVNLTAAVLMAIAFVPYGIEMIRGGQSAGDASSLSGAALEHSVTIRGSA